VPSISPGDIMRPTTLLFNTLLRSCADLRATAPLLQDVRQFVGQQAAACRVIGCVLAGAEHDLIAVGIRTRMNALR
jgi:hypothetical protein